MQLVYALLDIQPAKAREVARAYSNLPGAISWGVMDGADADADLPKIVAAIKKEEARQQALAELKKREPVEEGYLVVEDFVLFSFGIVSADEAKKIFERLLTYYGPGGKQLFKTRDNPPAIKIASFMLLLVENQSEIKLLFNSTLNAEEFVWQFLRQLVNLYCPQPRRTRV